MGQLDEHKGEQGCGIRLGDARGPRDPLGAEKGPGRRWPNGPIISGGKDGHREKQQERRRSQGTAFGQINEHPSEQSGDIRSADARGPRDPLGAEQGPGLNQRRGYYGLLRTPVYEGEWEYHPPLWGWMMPYASEICPPRPRSQRCWQRSPAEPTVPRRSRVPNAAWLSRHILFIADGFSWPLVLFWSLAVNAK